MLAYIITCLLLLSTTTQPISPQKYLENSLEHYNKTVKNYTCTLEKQEVLLGKDKMTKKQIIDVKFKEDPFSVVVKWEKNPLVASKILYVEGKNNGKMIVKPSGIAGWFIKKVERDPEDKNTYKTSRHFITNFGIKNILIMIIEGNKKAEKHDELDIKYKKHKKYVVIERSSPDKERYKYGKVIIYCDKELKLPVKIECYDKKGKLVGIYEFKNIKINVGLTDKDFLLKENGF